MNATALAEKIREKVQVDADGTWIYVAGPVECVQLISAALADAKREALEEAIATVESFQAPGARARETQRIGGMAAVSAIRTALRAKATEAHHE